MACVGAGVARRHCGKAEAESQPWIIGIHEPCPRVLQGNRVRRPRMTRAAQSNHQKPLCYAVCHISTLLRQLDTQPAKTSQHLARASDGGRLSALLVDRRRATSAEQGTSSWGADETTSVRCRISTFYCQAETLLPISDGVKLAWTVRVSFSNFMRRHHDNPASAHDDR